MRHIQVALGIYLLLLPTIGLADFRIIRLEEDERTAAVSQDGETMLSEGDRACAYQKEEKITCGPVVSASEEEATIVFPEDGERPLVGDEIRPSKKKGKKLTPKRSTKKKSEAFGESSQDDDSTNPSSTEESSPEPAPPVQTTEEEDKRRELIRYHRNLIQKRYSDQTEATVTRKLSRAFDISLGGALYGETTTQSIWPYGLFQWALDSNNIIGIQAGYLTFGGNSVTGTTWYGVANFHYYPYEPFLGPTGRFGIGLGSSDYSVNTGGVVTTGKTTPIVVNGSLGWRFLFDKQISLGIEAGLQLHMMTVNTFFTTTATTSNVTLLLPLFSIELGFAF